MFAQDSTTYRRDGTKGYLWTAPHRLLAQTFVGACSV